MNETINQTVETVVEEVIDACFWKWDGTKWMCSVTDWIKSMDNTWWSFIVGAVLFVIIVRVLFKLFTK